MNCLFLELPSSSLSLIMSANENIVLRMLIAYTLLGVPNEIILLPLVVWSAKIGLAVTENKNAVCVVWNSEQYGHCAAN